MSQSPSSDKSQEPKFRQLNIFDIQEFVKERFNEVKTSNKMKDLVRFHSINKYLLMSHSQIKLNKLGNIIANHNENSFKEIIDEYEPLLFETLGLTPTVKSNSNVLYHIFGHFSKQLTIEEKNNFLNMLAEYQSGIISLECVLIEMKKWISKFDKTYLIRQTYFLFNTKNSLNFN